MSYRLSYLENFHISNFQNPASEAKEYPEYIGHFLLEFFFYEVVTYDPLQ